MYEGFLCENFVTRCFWQWGVVSTSPNPQSGGPPLVGCPRLLIQYTLSYHRYWRPFLHPQIEDQLFSFHCNYCCRPTSTALTLAVVVQGWIRTVRYSSYVTLFFSPVVCCACGLMVLFPVVLFVMLKFYFWFLAQLVEALRYKPEGRGFDSR
jgi:hypothetical protein